MRPHRWQPARLPVPGILQARTLEWVAISFSNAWKWKVKVRSLSRVQLLATPGTAAYQAPPSMGFSSQEYWSGVPLPSPRLSTDPTKNERIKKKSCFKKICQVERLLTVPDETYTWVNYMTHGFPSSCLFFNLQLHLKLAKEWCTKERQEQFHKRIIFVILLFESHHWCNGHELRQTSGDGEGQGGLACYGPWVCKESDMTGWLNNNSNILFYLILKPAQDGDTINIIYITKDSF